jgi:uncharacterized protein YggE
MSRIATARFWSQIAALSLAVGAIGVIGVKPTYAQEQQDRVLVVNGQATIDVPTSVTQVSLGIEVQGKTAQEVQSEVARRSNGLISLLRSRNVEKLQTTGVYLNPVYTYNPDNGESKVTGYSATNSVSFRVTTDRAGSIIDEAVASGATRVDGISFIASNEALEAARQQALRAAIDDAQSQADTVLDALNLTRQEIVNINISSSTPMPQPLAFALENRDLTGGFAQSTALVGGEQQVQAYVSLSIGY